MIRIEGSEIRLEGTFETLLSETGKALFSIVQAMEKEIDGFEFEEAIAFVLKEFKDLRSSKHGLNQVPEEFIENFHKRFKKMKRKKDKIDNYIEYTSGIIDIDTSVRNPIQSALKGFSVDPRSADNIDIDDLKAIKRRKNGKKS